MSQVAFFWLLLRFLSWFFVSLFSTINPITDLEKNIAFLPPSQDISIWAVRTFLSPWQRWDVTWYLKILSAGYAPLDGTAQFHPLYPVLAKGLDWIGLHPMLSLLAVSSISGLGFLLVFEKLAGLDETLEQARLSTIFLLFFPVSIVLFAPYTEATFLLFAALCLYWCRKQSWWLAGLAGALACLTRQQGILLLIPMAWELWRDHTSRKEAPPALRIKPSKMNWLSLALPPFGYTIWLAYRLWVLNDFQVNLGSLQDFIYSALISSSSSQVVPVQEFTLPWVALARAVDKLRNSPDTDIWVNLVGLVLFLFLTALTWRHLRLGYRYFVLANLLLSISYYTGPAHPYMGLLRHCLLGFPIFIGISQVVRYKWERVVLFSLFGVGWCFLLLLFSFEAWVL